MRKALLFIICLLTLTGCSTPTDVANQIYPVSSSLAGIRITLAELSQLPADRRNEVLKRDWPHLADDVAYYARQHRLVSAKAKIERIDFLFGSLKKVAARDGSGAGHEGYIKDELIALIWIRGGKPIHVIVYCLNGMVADTRELDRLQFLKTEFPKERFTIGPREGLVHHVDYPLAIDLAERFNLPLFVGRRMAEQKRITPERARRMEPNTARVQVTVRVNEGDRFDLVAGTYTPAKRNGRRTR